MIDELIQRRKLEATLEQLSDVQNEKFMIMAKVNDHEFPSNVKSAIEKWLTRCRNYEAIGEQPNDSVLESHHQGGYDCYNLDAGILTLGVGPTGKEIVDRRLCIYHDCYRNVTDFLHGEEISDYREMYEKVSRYPGRDVACVAMDDQGQTLLFAVKTCYVHESTFKGIRFVGMQQPVCMPINIELLDFEPEKREKLVSALWASIATSVVREDPVLLTLPPVLYTLAAEAYTAARTTFR